MAGGGVAGHGASAGETNLPPLTPGPYRRRLGFVALVATFGGLLFGYDTSVINGAGGFMARPDQLDLSPLGLGVAASSLVYAAVVGAFTGGRISDAWGRKRTIAVLAVMFIIGVAVVSIAPSLAFVVVGRVVLGLAVGAAAVVVPVFLAELAPFEIRGSLAGRNEMMIVTGQLVDVMGVSPAISPLVQAAALAVGVSLYTVDWRALWALVGRRRPVAAPS